MNGVKNGFVNGTNHVISRDDNLILVPEPTNKQMDHETISFAENKVYYIFHIKFQNNTNDNK